MARSLARLVARSPQYRRRCRLRRRCRHRRRRRPVLNLLILLTTTNGWRVCVCVWAAGGGGRRRAAASALIQETRSCALALVYDDMLHQLLTSTCSRC